MSPPPGTMSRFPNAAYLIRALVERGPRVHKG